LFISDIFLKVWSAVGGDEVEAREGGCGGSCGKGVEIIEAVGTLPASEGSSQGESGH